MLSVHVSGMCTSIREERKERGDPGIGDIKCTNFSSAIIPCSLKFSRIKIFHGLAEFCSKTNFRG